MPNLRKRVVDEGKAFTSTIMFDRQVLRIVCHSRGVPHHVQQYGSTSQIPHYIVN